MACRVDATGGPPPGTRVQLHSMKMESFNDLAGTVLGPAPTNSFSGDNRFIVQLDAVPGNINGGNINGVTKSVKVTNIRPEGRHTYLSAPHL